jgi:hypothetical protein
MKIDERTPVVAGLILASVLILCYTGTDWHRSAIGLATFLAVELLVLGAGAFISLQLRKKGKGSSEADGG